MHWWSLHMDNEFGVTRAESLELDHAYTPAHLFIRCHSVICAMTVVDLAFPFLPIKILPGLR